MENTNNDNQEDNINTEAVNDVRPEKSKRGRKKKSEGEKIVSELKAWDNQAVESPTFNFSNPYRNPISLNLNSSESCIWDNRGLLKNIEYKYDSYGFVDWRAMINPKHIVLNRNSVAKAGYVYEALSDSDREKFLNEWPDDKKVIRLAGFKEVARLRGYYSVDNQIKQEGEKVICHCTIQWARNFEGQFTYTAVASASPANVAPDYVQFLEAVACNRAFSRAVRESLNIHIVSDEELDQNKVEEVSNKNIPSTHPRAQLIKVCQEKGIEFSTVKLMIGSLNIDNEDIVSFDTIPAPTAMAVLAEIRKG